MLAPCLAASTPVSGRKPLLHFLQVDVDALGLGHLVNQRDGVFAIGAAGSEYLDVHGLFLFHFKVGAVGQLRQPDIHMFEVFERSRVKTLHRRTDVGASLYRFAHLGA